MKIICIGAILFLCLSSSLAWTRNQETQDDNEAETLIQNVLDAPSEEINQDDDEMELLNELDATDLDGGINNVGTCYKFGKCQGPRRPAHNRFQCCRRIKGRSFKRRGSKVCQKCHRHG